MRLHLAHWAASAVLAAGLCSLAAQTHTRDLHGRVHEQSGEPLRGAVVEIKDTNTLAIRSFITGRDGLYHFSALNPDGWYEVRASYHGKWSSTHTLSRFNEKPHPELDILVRVE
jgi:hypothetical protein